LDPRILELERCALAAWPAEEVVDLDGWRLRAMRGVTRRANSVGTAASDEGAPRALSLVHRLERVHEFYSTRSLPALLQVSAASLPPELDAELARRGYAMEAPVSVQTLALRDARALAPAGCRTSVEATASDPWLELSVRRGRYAEAQDTYRGLLTRLGERARFAVAYDQNEPAAAALGVAQGTWFGVFSMLTLPEHRRRGLGRELLVALGEEARRLGCEGLYLQVELENAAARSLYARAGFREAYRYHYRVAHGF
jgi:GNAT superfamily N-acetyltransferase